MIEGRLMNEGAISSFSSAEKSSEQPPDSGSLLREAREAAGLSIEALASILKVPVGKLGALESGQWDQLPDTVFARALAASVCRVLKVDPAAVMTGLPAVTPRYIPDDQGINKPFKDASGSAGGLAPGLSRPLMLLVGALLLGALALYLMPPLESWPALWPGRDVTSTESGKPASSGLTDLSGAAAQKASAVAPPVQSTGDGMRSEPALPTAAASVNEAPQTATLPGSIAVPPVADKPASAAAPVAEGPLVFATTGDSWIEVTDARGVVVFKQLMQAGQTASASGTLPLTVVVGRADVTALSVNGKPFDLTPHSRSNVARFDIKP